MAFVDSGGNTVEAYLQSIKKDPVVENARLFFVICDKCDDAQLVLNSYWRALVNNQITRKQYDSIRKIAQSKKYST